ncbi:MAG: metallophosphoesterase family protein [Deltaproteobacteria bacterium]|nr:metallophosphoesterase family protein [Deltaproteobacteria bacterium]
MRVVWVTDVHLNFVEVERMKAFADAIMRERPDRIFVTGDTAEAHDVEKCFDLMRAIAPCHGVLGNHDYYGSSIAALRDRARRTGWWLPHEPVRLTEATMLVGVDGWGDGRCGNLESRVLLSDWKEIAELDGLLFCESAQRCAKLQAVGAAEADALRIQLATLEPTRELIVLTHVPPFPEACWYQGKQSSPDWLPWFTCVAVGEVLLAHARAHPAMTITVLCGHTHGTGEYRPVENLVVRTGGWPPGVQSYGNPIVQDAWAIL